MFPLRYLPLTVSHNPPIAPKRFPRSLRSSSSSIKCIATLKPPAVLSRSMLRPLLPLPTRLKCPAKTNIKMEYVSMAAPVDYMDFVFVRHGETRWNENGEILNLDGERVQGPLIQGSSDISLNANGVRQAEESALVIAASSQTYKEIICSPLKRAATTAQIIAEKIGLTVAGDNNFAACSWGDCEGRTKAYRSQRYQFDSNGNYRGPSWEQIPTRDRWNYQPIPGAESMLSIIERMKTALEKKASVSKPGEKVLVVCHQENIKAFILHCMEEEIEKARQRKDLEMINQWEKKEIKNCGLYQFRYNFKTWVFSFLNLDRSE